MNFITNIARSAAKAAKLMAMQSAETKSKLLNDMANALRESKEQIFKANTIDITFAEKNRQLL